MLPKLWTLLACTAVASGVCLGGEKRIAPDREAVIWSMPADIESRDLFYGAGGKEHEPRGSFRFVEENRDGTNPKFTVEDQDGVQWKVKLGEEVRSETAATRLLWAVGYHTDEDYLVPQLQVGDLPRLKRGAKFVEPDGSVRNARLERQLKGEKRIGYWRWKDYRSGGREWNGLRVMMSLLNNWDLKDVNNAVYADPGDPDARRIYLVSDLGATFGSPGYSWPMSKAKDNLDTYRKSKFIKRLTPEYVSFSAPARPALIRFYEPLSFSRLRMRWIGRRIPRDDAKWIGGLLARLSPRQIGDAFRASGYSADEVDGFTRVVQERIDELKSL